MTKAALIAELAPLLEALCEDRLTPEEAVRVERLVLSSPEARWLYLTYVDLHGSLYWDAAGVGSATALSSDEIPVSLASATPIAGPLPPTPAVKALPDRARSGSIFAACATAVCLFVGLTWHLGAGKPSYEHIAQSRPITPQDARSAVDNTAENATKLGHRTHGPEISIAAKETQSSIGVTEPLNPASPTVVPPPPEPHHEDLDARSVVDAINSQIRRNWDANELRPSAIAEDAEWLRRVSLDLIGRIPTIDEAESFLASRRPRKRQELIDQLLDDSAYARNLTTIWANLLVGRRSEPRIDRGSLQKFLRMSFAANRPWNQIVYDLVAAEGNTRENGAANFLVAHLNNDALPATAVTSRIFLGQQIQCNQCHNNPFTKTQQAAFWEMHSFFSQTASVPRHERDPRTGKLRYAYTELVTHDAGVAARAGRVLRMLDGRIQGDTHASREPDA